MERTTSSHARTTWAAVAESVESNNCRASTATIRLTLPDLIVTAISNPPAAAVAGSSFSVTDTVRNQGTAASAVSATRYYLSFDGQKTTGDTLLTGSRAVSSLAPGASAAGGPITVQIPAITPLGTYHLLACAADAGAIAETDETNNCLASLTQIVVIR